MANNLKVLKYLNSLSDKYKFHYIDSFLESIGLTDYNSKYKILNDLLKENFIEFVGGVIPTPIISGLNPEVRSEEFPFEAKITPKGESYLSKRLNRVYLCVGIIIAIAILISYLLFFQH